MYLLPDMQDFVNDSKNQDKTGNLCYNRITVYRI